MTCPVCGGKTRVIDSRQPDCERVVQRRECVECGHRFTTEECEVVWKKEKSEEEKYA